MLLFLPPTQTHAEYRLSLYDFNQNRDCVDVSSKKVPKTKVHEIRRCFMQTDRHDKPNNRFFATPLRRFILSDITLRYNQYCHEPEINPQPNEADR